MNFMNIEHLILGIPALLLAISMHELAHGLVAYRLGDPTAKHQGRLTLNPLAHLDPIGAIMLFVFRFGWAKPVQVNPLYFKEKNKGMMLVAFAGPLANITLAWLFYVLFTYFTPLMPNYSLISITRTFFLINLQLNLGLAAFNLLPVPPLDGSKILSGLLPARLSYQYQSFSQYGPIVLLLLLMTGTAQTILRPIYRILLMLISGFQL